MEKNKRKSCGGLFLILQIFCVWGFLTFVCSVPLCLCGETVFKKL